MDGWPDTWGVGDCIEHLETCSGCKKCEALIEFYMACDRCGGWGSKQSTCWEHIEGRFYCLSCADEINNGVE